MSEIDCHQPADLYTSGKTILVVDDDWAILDLVSNYLVKLGATVLRAESEGIRASEAHFGPIHLLLTDVDMPLRNDKKAEVNLNLGCVKTPQLIRAELSAAAADTPGGPVHVLCTKLEDQRS